MRSYLSLLGGLLITSFTTFAQNDNSTAGAKGKLIAQYYPTDMKPGQVEFIGFRNEPSDDLSWQPSLSHISKNESEDDELLEKVKSAKDRLKAQASAEAAAEMASKTTTVPPVVSTNFAGINNGGGNTPLDNTIAISNAGKIVVMVNSKIGYYDTTGTNTYLRDLDAFVNDATLTTNLCDPKVIYDNVADRFIIYIQTCDLDPPNSKVILAFSKTNDPAAGWYFYKLSGNPLGDNSFFDYPKIGISNDEVFVTGNLFFVSGSGSSATTSFNQSMIYQVAKAPCYAGGTASVKKYTGISGAFTIVPASLGIKGSYGPGIFLASSDGNSGFGSYDYKMYRITNNIASGTAVLNQYSVPSAGYSPAGSAPQMGTTQKLNTGDTRGMDAFYLHGYIHFVHHRDVGSGYSGIGYVRIKVADQTCVETSFGAGSNADKCFPGISTLTNDSLDKSVLITYNEVSSTFYPRTCVVACGNNLGWSNPVTVKTGLSYVDYGFSGSTDRWGDYNGMCRRYNSTPAASWMAGMYGNSSKKWSQWIAKVTGTTNIGVPEIAVESNNVSVFPNPIYDDCSVKFELKERTTLSVSVIDMQGKVVKELYNGTSDKGELVFSFNKANLSAGTYFVRIYGNSNLIKNEKIVILDK